MKIRRLSKPFSASTRRPFITVSIGYLSSIGVSATRYPQRRPGVDRYNCPGNPSRARRRQEDISAGDVVGQQRDLQRVAGAQPVRDIGIAELGAAVLMERRQTAQVGDRTARGNAIDPDPRPEFHRELTDSSDDRVLGGGVERAAASRI